MTDRRRARRRRTLLLCVLLLAAAAAVTAAVRGWSDGSVHVLPESFEYLPYEFKHASPSDDARVRFMDLDLDHDGISEGVTLSRYDKHDENFIGVYRYAESQRYSISQINLPVKATLMGVADLNGDERPEIVYLSQRPLEPVMFIVEEFFFDGDAVGHRIIGTVAWDAADSHMDNGLWGGDGYLVDAFDHDGDGMCETLLIGLSTGIKRYPRGFWELNWVSGTIGRKLATGGSPTTESVFIDTDGDGSDEIVFGIESPGNNAFSAPFSDKIAYVAAASDFSLLWWKEVAGYSARVDLTSGDIDADGSEEIVFVTGGHSEQLADDLSMTVLRASDGAQLARLAYDVPANDVEIADVDGTARLFVSLADGTLRRYRYSGGEFIEERRFRNEEGIASVEIVDLGLPTSAPGLIIETAKGTIIACDLALAPLAAFHTDEAVHIETPIVPTVFPVMGSPTPGAIVQTQERVRFLYIERIWPPAWVRRAIDALRDASSVLLVALGTLAVAAAALPRYRRRAVGAFRRRLLPRRRREAELDEFLEQLKTGGHGMLSATKTLRRLAGQFTMLSQHEGDMPDAFVERYAEGLANAREVGLPMVQSIAESVRRLGLAPLELSTLTDAVDDVRDVLEDAPSMPPLSAAAELIRTRLERDLERIERGVAVARREAGVERSIAVAAEVDRVLRARGSQLERPGLSVETDGLERLGDTRVLGTPTEFAFVFDNLIENALRAVRGESAARIGIQADVHADAVTLEVRDNGAGIDPEQHERIFLPGVSEREGGGHGLPRSREILDRRGGSIELVRSAPGEGTLFRVTMKVVSCDA